MVAFRQRRNTVIEQPRRPAPHRDIAVLQPKPARLVTSLQATKHEDRGQAQRDRDDRSAEIKFVLILMQGHLRPGNVAVDQTDVRRKSGEASAYRSATGEISKRLRHRRPWLAGLRIFRIVAITTAVGHPTTTAAIGHRDRHLMPTRREHPPERRRCNDLAQRRDQLRFAVTDESAQEHGAFGHFLSRSPHSGKASKQIRRQPILTTIRHTDRYLASWKITPTVWRRPERSRLTPCRILTR